MSTYENIWANAHNQSTTFFLLEVWQSCMQKQNFYFRKHELCEHVCTMFVAKYLFGLDGHRVSFITLFWEWPTFGTSCLSTMISLSQVMRFFKSEVFRSIGKKRFQGAEAGLWQTLQKNNLFPCRTAAFPDFWVFSSVSRFGCVFCVCLCLSVCFCLCVWCVILLCVWVSVYLYVVVCVCASGGRGRRVVGTGEAGRGQGWVVRVLGRRWRAGWGWVMVAKGIIVHWGLGAAGQGA